MNPIVERRFRSKIRHGMTAQRKRGKTCTARLGNEGVIFEKSHSVFPTVTRVNSASLSTGMQPAHHGIMGNQIYIPAVDPVNAFSNDNFLPLLKLGELTDGRIVLTPSIAELTTEIGHRYVAVSSGSTS